MHNFPQNTHFPPLEAWETSHSRKVFFLKSNVENCVNKILLLLQIVKRDQIKKGNTIQQLNLAES